MKDLQGRGCGVVGDEWIAGDGECGRREGVSPASALQPYSEAVRCTGLTRRLASQSLRSCGATPPGRPVKRACGARPHPHPSPKRRGATVEAGGMGGAMWPDSDGYGWGWQGSHASRERAAWEFASELHYPSHAATPFGFQRAPAARGLTPPAPSPRRRWGAWRHG